MEEQKQAKQQMQIDSDILNTLSTAVRVSKKKGNLDRDEYKKGINASKTETLLLFLLFEDVLKKFDMPSTDEDKLSIASALLKGVNYTIKNIEELCPILSKSYANETNSIGIFISAAINKIIKETDTINLDFAGIEVNCLGYCLTRGNLIIKGSVGDDTGHSMQSGSITIHGNAGDRTGDSMEDGSIIVDGNAGKYTGDFMQSGSITIHGNSGDFTGDYMKGGSIIVEGNSDADTGISMQSGSITIHGNAGDATGYYMEGGSIIVDGNAGDWTGYSMQSGSITIHGNAGEGTGRLSEGGEIRINGKIGSLWYSRAVIYNGRFYYAKKWSIKGILARIKTVLILLLSDG